MSTQHIEYAGGYTLAAVNESRAAAIARAPAWWRKLARETYQRNAPAPASPAAKPTASRRERLQPWAGWGWVAGVCAPGVSVPAYSERDGERLPEQLTPACWERILQHINTGKRAVHLTWGHGGPVLASSPLDLTFRLHPLFGMGLTFTARLRAGVLPAGADAALSAAGLGVSIGFALPKGWVTERSGVGRVRIIDECVLDHVALIAPGSNMSPAYSGARCYGIAGQRYGCPPDVRERAELYAYRTLKTQAGARL